MLFSDFKAPGPISIPTPPFVVLTEFFHADVVANVNPLSELWYLISSLCVHLCSWMHIMSMLWSMGNAVSSSSCSILFKILTLNVTICIVCLHFSNFCLRGPQALKLLNSIKKIQPRMMVATFNGHPSITIISCYSPTNDSEETGLIAFYDELSSLVRSIPKHYVLVIGRDMNAQIGKNRKYKFSLHNSSNRNGQHLTDFMIENRLTCLNTNFQKKGGENLGPTHTQTILKHR